MSEQNPSTPDARPAETYAEVEDALLSRWPETRLEPSLDRIQAFTELLGEPQRSFRTIHLTGTNGKTSTSRMIETLVRALDLRTGRFTSPHLEKMSERISIDGETLTDEEFVRAFNDVAAYTHLVDADQAHPLSFFETMVGMAYAAFADAPGRRRRRRGRHGRHVGRDQRRRRRRRGRAADRGRPRAVPRRLPDRHRRTRRPASSSRARSPCSPSRSPTWPPLLIERAAEVGATVAREGMEFGVCPGCPPSAARCSTLQGLRGRYDDVFLPLYGAHQAQNAAVALAAVEAFAGDEPLDDDLVRAAFAEVTSPGPARDHPPQPDDRARRRPQPARGGGDRGRDRGLVHVLAADRRDGRDGRQGRRRRCWRPSSRTSSTSSAPRTPPRAR